MAIDYTTKDGFLTGESGYPYGKANNASGPQQKDGSVHDADTRNDIVGFFAAMLVDAGIVPSGNPEKSDASQYLEALNLLFGRGLGIYTSYLFDDSGTLKLTEGRIGLDNGTGKFNFNIPSVVTIDISSVTSGHWFAIELSESSGLPVFTALELTETTPEFVPPTFKNSWDDSKTAFHINPTKRTIGIGFKDSGALLSGIINCYDNMFGYYGKIFIDLPKNDFYKIDKKINYFSKQFKIYIGSWAMTATVSVAFTLNIPIDKINDIACYIIADNLTQIRRIEYANSPSGTSGVCYFSATNTLTVSRYDGSIFDSVGHDNPLINRGYIYIDVEE